MIAYEEKWEGMVRNNESEIEINLHGPSLPGASMGYIYS
jgi:hypothetical protein